MLVAFVQSCVKFRRPLLAWAGLHTFRFTQEGKVSLTKEAISRHFNTKGVEPSAESIGALVALTDKDLWFLIILVGTGSFTMFLYH